MNETQPIIQRRSKGRVVVFGANGHTGQFVVAELFRRGITPVLVARDIGKLKAAYSGQALEARVASIESQELLDRAFRDASVVINCAGPFLDTARPIIESALRSGASYLDLAAEQASVQDTFERFDRDARAIGVIIAPAMAFYGGLADLMVTGLMEGWEQADSLEIGIALDSWMPTLGTRLTGKRNVAQRLVVADHRLIPLANPAPQRVYEFPTPFGTQDVIAMPFSETITISKHLRIANMDSYINLTPIDDIRNPDTPPPVAADASGRSAQVFMLDVLVRRGSQIRRATARGRDIYAVTAPIVVEAATRVVNGNYNATGACAAGELFDARDFLGTLAPEHMSVDFDLS